MIKRTISLFLTLVLTHFSVVSHAQKLDLNIGINQQILAESFIVNFNEAIPISPIRAGDITEKVAYQIADLYVAELIKQEGKVAGYKVGTFAKGEYDNGWEILEDYLFGCTPFFERAVFCISTKDKTNHKK